MIEPEAHVGEIIAVLRKRRRWSQLELGKRTGMYSVRIGQIERLQAQPREMEIRALAIALEVSIACLFGEEDLPPFQSESQPLQDDNPLGDALAKAISAEVVRGISEFLIQQKETLEQESNGFLNS